MCKQGSETSAGWMNLYYFLDAGDQIILCVIRISGCWFFGSDYPLFPCVIYSLISLFGRHPWLIHWLVGCLSCRCQLLGLLDENVVYLFDSFCPSLSV